MAFVFGILRLACYALMIAVIVRIVFSWVAPRSFGNPIFQLSYRVTEPVLRPVRNLFPPSGLDFSPMVVMVALSLISNALR